MAFERSDLVHVHLQAFVQQQCASEARTEGIGTDVPALELIGPCGRK